jgi:hypothetical protein
MHDQKLNSMLGHFMSALFKLQVNGQNIQQLLLINDLSKTLSGLCDLRHKPLNFSTQ